MERCEYCRSWRDGGAEGAGVVVRKSNDTTRRKIRTRRARLSRDEGDRRGYPLHCDRLARPNDHYASRQDASDRYVLYVHGHFAARVHLARPSRVSRRRVYTTRALEDPREGGDVLEITSTKELRDLVSASKAGGKVAVLEVRRVKGGPRMEAFAPR